MQFVDTFLEFNADLPAANDFVNKLQQIKLGSGKTIPPQQLYFALSTFLQTQKTTAAFLIFDEHNELFKRIGKSTPLERQPNFLNSFTRWTSKFAGVRNLCFY
jgi:hypothetical protein